MNKIITFLFCTLLYSCSKTEIVEVNTENFNYDIALKTINDLRKQGCQCGNVYFKPTTQLSWNEQLKTAALNHSKDMAEKNYFSHVSPTGLSPQTRISNSGYNWKYFGENIFKAQGFKPTEQEVIFAWKESPGHCANLMKPEFKEIGMAEYKNHWTQVFGSK
jgi:uncharacterized protein YkwD